MIIIVAGDNSQYIKLVLKFFSKSFFENSFLIFELQLILIFHTCVAFWRQCSFPSASFWLCLPKEFLRRSAAWFNILEFWWIYHQIFHLIKKHLRACFILAEKNKKIGTFKKLNRITYIKFYSKSYIPCFSKASNSTFEHFWRTFDQLLRLRTFLK